MAVSKIRRNGDGLAPIENGVTYPLGCFMVRNGMSRSAMREARRRGLKVIKVGKRMFVRGADWNQFLERCAEVAV